MQKFQFDLSKTAINRFSIMPDSASAKRLKNLDSCHIIDIMKCVECCFPALVHGLKVYHLDTLNKQIAMFSNKGHASWSSTVWRCGY